MAKKEEFKQPLKAPINLSSDDNAKSVDQLSSNNEGAIQLPFKNLKIGEIFQITPLSDTAGVAKYTAKYIGGIDKKSLICTVPTIDEKTMFVKEFNGFSVQFFSGKNIYRFNTVVDAVFNRPYPHMHLMYPREVMTNRLRKNQRINVAIIASIRNLTKGPRAETMFSGKLTDLSLGGALIEVYKNAAEEGDVVECTFKVRLETQEILLVVKGVIKNISTGEALDGRAHYHYGMQFKEMALQEKIVLQNYIFKVMTGEKLEDI